MKVETMVQSTHGSECLIVTAALDDVCTRMVGSFVLCWLSLDHSLCSRDRMPFLTRLADGVTSSFAAAPNNITENLIVANYGGSQVRVKSTLASVV